MTRTFDTNRIDAINEMLSAVGEAPVNSVTSNSTSGVRMAENILDMVEREVQANGWHWNTEEGFTLTPNADNRFEVPKDWIRADVVVGRYGNRELVKRGSYIYDVRNRTNVLGTSLSSLVVSAVVFLDWEEMPETARRYIMIRAARIFQDRVADSARHHVWTQEDEALARANLLQEETSVGDFNYLQTPLMRAITSRGETPLRDVGGDTSPPPEPIHPIGG